MKTFFNDISWIINKCRSSLVYIIILSIICSLISYFSVYTAVVTKYVIDSASDKNIQDAKKFLILLSILLVLNIVLNSISIIISSYSCEKTKNIIQKNLYLHILNSSYIEVNSYHSIDLLTRITNDSSEISSMLINSLPSCIGFIVMICSSFYALFLISPVMSLFALLVIPSLIIISRLYGKKLKKYYLKIQQKESLYNKFIEESINNILIIKTFCMISAIIKNFILIQDKKLHLQIKKSFTSTCYNAVLSLNSLLSYAAVFSWGAVNIAKGSLNCFGSLTAMLQLFNSITGPLFALSKTFPQIISAAAASERLKEIEKIPVENNNPLDLQEIKKNICCSIKFENVSFGYVKDKLILKNISVKFNKNELIGIIGLSGKGKTTLIKLIMSLIYPTEGQIYIDDELLNINHRHLISYVPQGNTLFSASIIENLRCGNKDIEKAEIYNALKASAAYDFVSSLPLKEDTIIGENGINLSGGEAQRICIARALMRKKPILILDEATSSLDAETEKQILYSISNLKFRPICIIITHRLSALSICTRVLKLENGKLENINAILTK